MAADINIRLVLDAVPSPNKVEEVLCAIQHLADQHFAEAEYFVDLTGGLPYRSLDIARAVELVRSGVFDEACKNEFSMEVGKQRWGAIELSFNYSPLTRFACSLWVSEKEGCLLLDFDFYTQRVLDEALPHENDLWRKRASVLTETEYYEFDPEWHTHYRPAWPINVKMLLTIVHSILLRYNGQCTRITREFLNPEGYADLIDLDELLELTDKPPCEKYTQ